ncbi:hypothetical protein PVAP13_2KG358405 [Panicum virgatum]|uniref:Uncharacterized protein n=1 Tax=Panicum virgatum TaxID=38727 RepID=A0A8T0WD42_PANVG|nr:hypothetical protein PVAP13_2KG358405 [Panicum virgatum]
MSCCSDGQKAARPLRGHHPHHPPCHTPSADHKSGAPRADRAHTKKAGGAPRPIPFLPFPLPVPPPPARFPIHNPAGAAASDARDPHSPCARPRQLPPRAPPPPPVLLPVAAL